MKKTAKLNLLPYQQKAYDYVLSKPSCGLFLDMGLGKTAVVLSAIANLLADDPSTGRILIVGPKRVIEQTWPDELAKWSDFQHIKYSVIAGSAKQRKEAAIRKDVHLHLVSRDNLAWLIKEGLFHFGTVVIDELSSFKNPTSQRFKALKAVLPRVSRVIGMTGTPAPKGLQDLWSQVYLLDSGFRLGKTISAYRQKYFDMSLWGSFPEYKPKTGAQDQIMESIKDICMSMTQEDYLRLPDLVPVQHVLKVPSDLQKTYKDFKEEMVLTLQKEGEYITASNAGVLAGKLLQFCGGNIYGEEREVYNMHTVKIDALEQLYEEANGNPLLVYYAYVHEKNQIMSRFPEAIDIKSPGAIDKWNAGEVPMMVAHPASAGHGLNLQHGGNTVVWYNMTYDLELYQQACKRLHRMGQTKPVILHHLLMEGGIDYYVLNEVLTRKASLAATIAKELKQP
jgi:hypothetical protein